MKPKLAFTCGDPAGVGPDVILDWLKKNPTLAPEVAVIGGRRWLQSAELHGAQPIAVGEESFVATPGQPTINGAKLAWDALERAAVGTRAGEFSAVVTGPVSKEWLQKAGYPFPGQTEFFAERWGGDATMAFCGGKLQVALLTWHIPLREVPAHLTKGEIARTVVAIDELARATASSPEIAARGPRIGVCGLNPHAGEAGLLGDEEIKTVDPILDELRKTYPRLSRTQPADTIFARQLRGEFDAIVALYHDQGLAPLKTVDFDESVNVTLGLPFVRTSPDHGTAFGIAGKGQASSTSFSNAVKVAQQLIAARGNG
ncbi:MAG TPA: 4-hydroxythreonine-4-phosphate dehydrogenase PdxA [Opitutaceae bacterium]